MVRVKISYRSNDVNKYVIGEIEEDTTSFVGIRSELYHDLIRVRKDCISEWIEISGCQL